MPLVRDRHPLARHWVIWQQVTDDGTIDRGCVYVVDWAQNLSIPDCREEKEDGLCREYRTRLHQSKSRLKVGTELVVVKHQGKQRLIDNAEFGIVCQEG